MEGEAQTQEGSEPAFGQVDVPIREVNTFVDISNQLLSDSACAHNWIKGARIMTALLQQTLPFEAQMRRCDCNLMRCGRVTGRQRSGTIASRN